LKRATEQALDAIYAGPQDDFIRGRDALAKELRAAGDNAGAKAVKRLRKPSKAAWVLNAFALEEPEAVERYLGLAGELRKASSGRVDANRLRELAREEGELLEEIVAGAGRLSRGVSAATLDRVRETLQAAQVDDELRQRVASGRVEREERAASVGLENLVAPPTAGTGGKKKAAARSSEDKDRKRRRAAEAELKEAKSEARAAARAVARAQTALTRAERDRDAAEEKAERAEARLAKLLQRASG
jgi:hypothetical protein